MKTECKTCSCCGQKILRNRHGFTGGLARILLKTAERYTVGEHFRLKDFLTHVEICNFQKLAYFGLSEKHRNTLGEHVSGEWTLTIRALNLIRGEEKVESWVETFANKVVDWSPERIGIADTIGTYLIPSDYAKAQTPAFEGKERQDAFNFNGKGA
jgi:hypothetical protein